MKAMGEHNRSHVYAVKEGDHSGCYSDDDENDVEKARKLSQPVTLAAPVSENDLSTMSASSMGFDANIQSIPVPAPAAIAVTDIVEDVPSHTRLEVAIHFGVEAGTDRGPSMTANGEGNV
jgi:hypothetical protein